MKRGDLVIVICESSDYHNKIYKVSQVTDKLVYMEERLTFYKSYCKVLYESD